MPAIKELECQGLECAYIHLGNSRMGQIWRDDHRFKLCQEALDEPDEGGPENPASLVASRMIDTDAGICGYTALCIAKAQEVRHA